MKADFSELIPLQKIPEMIGNVIRAKELAHFVYADIVGVGIIVAFLKQPSMILLPLLCLQKKRPNLGNER